MYKYVLVFVMLLFSYIASAQIPTPGGDDSGDCPVGYYWDGIECCLEGQTCNSTPPGGGNPDPPNDPPDPNGGGTDPLPVFNLCDWLPWLPGC